MAPCRGVWALAVALLLLAAAGSVKGAVHLRTGTLSEGSASW